MIIIKGNVWVQCTKVLDLMGCYHVSASYRFNAHEHWIQVDSSYQIHLVLDTCTVFSIMFLLKDTFISYYIFQWLKLRQNLNIIS